MIKTEQTSWFSFTVHVIGSESDVMAIRFGANMINSNTFTCSNAARPDKPRIIFPRNNAIGQKWAKHISTAN